MGIMRNSYLNDSIVVGSLVMLAYRLAELVCCRWRMNDDEVYFLKLRR
jgi:hypothetical protein